jgi:hypothetical protein
VPRLCEFYPDICLTSEEKHEKISVRIRKTSVSVRKTSVRVQYTFYQNTHTLINLHTHTHTHTHYKTHTYKHTHIKKQYKTTTVQINTNTVQDIPKLNSPNIQGVSKRALQL